MNIYKDSGVEWIGEIPGHWSVTKLKNQCQIIPSNVDKKSQDDEIEVSLCNYVDVYHNDFINCSLEFMIATANEHELKKFQLIKEDVLITKDSEDPYDIAVPALVVETQPKLVCGYHLSIVRSNNQRLRGSYLFWVLRDTSIASQLHRQATGITRWAIATRHVKNSSIPLPPLFEQQAIVAYLDKTCAAIDKTIVAKQKQLEILDALRKSIIHKAVIRGLDDSVELKDSGVEWLGRIPKHWRVRRIKYLCDILRGKFTHRPRNDPRLYDGPYAFIQTGDVASVGKYVEAYKQTLNEEGFKVSKQFPKGTLVMTIAANVGDVAILNFEACFPDSIVGFYPRHNVDIHYLYYLFIGMRQTLFSTSVLNIQHNLNVMRIGTLATVMPPTKEQRHIVDYLDKKCSELTDLRANIKQQISTLEQYRKSLIHECVTGKRRITDDVRDQL